jgi:hypothetical protein
MQVMRVLSMSESQLSNRVRDQQLRPSRRSLTPTGPLRNGCGTQVRAIERAAGSYAVIKMKQFAEVRVWGRTEARTHARVQPADAPTT